jgi:hypothetical protein
MKLSSYLASIVVGTGFTLLAGCSPTKTYDFQTGEVTLRAVTGLNPNNIQVRSFFANFMDKLNSAGEGLVRVQYLGSHNSNYSTRSDQAFPGDGGLNGLEG